MDMIPIASTRSGDSTSRDDDVYTEIQMNPESVSAAPAPADPLPHPEEEESEPEEAPNTEDNGVQPMSESSESDDMPVDAATATAVPTRSPTPPRAFRHILSMSGPRVIRTARKRVRLPNDPYASTSRARPHALASPPRITTSLNDAIAQLNAIPSASYSRPASPSTHASSSAAPISPVESPLHADPAISHVMQHLTDMEIDIHQIKGSLANIPGPDNFEDQERHLQRLERRLEDLGRIVNSIVERLDMTDHRIHATHRQVFAHGGLSDQYRRLQRMRDEDRMENRRMRRRINDLEEMMEAMRIG